MAELREFHEVKEPGAKHLVTLRLAAILIALISICILRLTYRGATQEAGTATVIVETQGRIRCYPPPGRHLVRAPGNFTLCLEPERGWHIVRAEVNGSEVSIRNNALTVRVAPATTIIVRVLAEPIKVKVLARIVGNGTLLILGPRGIVDNGTSLPWGSPIRVIARPAPHWRLLRIGARPLGAETIELAVANASTIELDRDIMILAYFEELPKHEVVVITHGGVHAEPTRAVIHHGEGLTIRLKAEYGYRITKILVDGAPAELEDGKLVIERVEHNMTVEAWAAPLPCKVTMLLQGRGMVELGNLTLSPEQPSRTLTIPYNDTLTFRIQPAEGWYLDDIQLSSGELVRIYDPRLLSPLGRHPPYALMREAGDYIAVIPVRSLNLTVRIILRPLQRLLRAEPAPVNLTLLTPKGASQPSPGVLHIHPNTCAAFLWPRSPRQIILRVRGHGTLTLYIFAGWWYDLQPRIPVENATLAVWAGVAICMPEGGTCIVEVRVNADHPIYYADLTRAEEPYSTMGFVFSCRVIWTNAPSLILSLPVYGGYASSSDVKQWRPVIHRLAEIETENGAYILEILRIIWREYEHS